MDENELKERLDTLDARLVDLCRLLLGESEHTRKHLDLIAERLEHRILAVEKGEKIVLTEVRGLATKVDRLTRPRGRANQPLIP
jgi:hypothetical protein